jgi:DNA-binding MarR family transcriptional regulator
MPPTPPPAPEPLIRLLWRVHSWFRTALIAALKAQDGSHISPAHVTLLSQLPDEGITIAGLARRLGVSSPTAHQWVHELVTTGNLTVSAHPSSSRAKIVRLTEVGMRRRAQVLGVLADLEAVLADRIGPAAVAAVRAALEASWGSPESAASGVGVPAPETSASF